MTERWKPEAGKQYWLIDLGFSKKIRPMIWNNDRIDNLNYACGNCFRTEAEAESAAEKVKALLLSLHDTTQVTTQVTSQVTTPFDELPDWCKVGEWVYIPERAIYAKIHSVEEEIFYQTISGGITSVKSYTELIQARLRPYNEVEMKALVGKVLESKDEAHLIYAFDKTTKKIETPYAFYDAQELLLDKLTINNAPCGKIEHLNDNGEWVE